MGRAGCSLWSLVVLGVALGSCSDSDSEPGVGASAAGADSGAGAGAGAGGANPTDGGQAGAADAEAEPPAGPLFVEVASEIGLDHQHLTDAETFASADAGGLAAGDYDGDGWVDLYAIGGPHGKSRLYRNRGDGSFERVDASVTALDGGFWTSALFADYDGDGWLDLFVGAYNEVGPKFFHNTGEGDFEDVSESILDEPWQAEGYQALSGLAFADDDLDGDLDFYWAHWATTGDEMPQQLWRNNGDGTFSNASDESGLTALFTGVQNLAFTPNFVDLNDDGSPDLLLTGDAVTSRVLLNDGDGTYFDVTDTTVITDENGMGAAIGDYDNDGILDWFVSSIWDPENITVHWGTSGNRLYRGLGNGEFEDVTDAAGVREGDWGWAACFADFDNDSALDLFHVTGANYFELLSASQDLFMAPPDLGNRFYEDQAKLFMAVGDGSFEERSVELGIDDKELGIGVACFDYDRDGDVDIAIVNSRGPLRLYENQLRQRAEGAAHYLRVRVRGVGSNPQAIGAIVRVRVDGKTQMILMRAGTNYLSQDPVEAHFGLGSHDRVDELEVQWPDGRVSRVEDPDVDTELLMVHPDVE